MAPFFRYSKEKNELTIDFGSSDEPAPTPTSDPTPEGPADTTSLPRFRGMPPPPPPLTLTDLWRGDAESLCAPTKADCVYEPTLVQAPAVPGDRVEDTPRTPPVVAAPSESKTPARTARLSLIFTDEAELLAEPKPAILPGSDSFFSGWVIFDQFFRPRVKTAEEERVANLPIPRRTGWMFIDMFLPREGATDSPRGGAAGGSTKPRFSFLTKFLMLALPLLAFVGYYQYASVSGATILGKTLSNSVNLERGLVGHWTFDGGDMLSASSAEDVSTNNNHAFVGGRAKADIGKIGQGVSSPGSTSYVSVSASSAINNVNIVSISFWRKGLSVQVNKFSWTIDPDSGLIGQSFSGGSETWFRDGGIQLNNNDWYHHVITYDKTSAANNPNWYIDGVQQNLLRVFNRTGSAFSDSSYQLYLMHAGSVGSIDDFRIYNRILSAKEIERLYKMGEGVKINTNTIPAGSTLEDGLVGYWSFNGQDFTDKVYDRSGQNNHGFLVNMATTSAKVAGKVGQGLKFDGTNDYVNVGSSIGNLTQKTVTAWVKPQTISSPDTILWRDEGWGFDINYGPLRLYQSFLNTGQWWTNSIIKQNQWQFVAVTYDNTSAGNAPVFYVNGVATSSYQVSAPTGTAKNDSGRPTNIGAFLTGGGSFDGTIDEVRIYNRILTADEIAQLYRSGSGVTIKNCREDSVQDANGNTYNTLGIGSQCWLDRNMNVGTRVSGGTTQTNNSTVEKWCYSNSDANCTANNPNKPDGGLYQWNEAMQYSTTPGARGICPAGFHIPTDAEWHTLEKFLTDSQQSCNPNRSGAYDCSPAGTKLKPNGGSRFEANLAGFGLSGSFFNRGAFGVFWSSSPSGGNAWYRYVSSGSAQVDRFADSQSLGFSVRCLQDS